MVKHLQNNAFIRPSGDLPQTLTLDEFVRVLESHEGFFVVENIEYDNVLYCGTDNLYFSYCFNFHTGRALLETLLIVDNIEYQDSSYIIGSQGKKHSLALKRIDSNGQIFT